MEKFIVDNINFYYCKNEHEFEEVFRYCKKGIPDNAKDIKSQFKYNYNSKDYEYPNYFFKINSEDAYSTIVLPAIAYIEKQYNDLQLIQNEYNKKEEYIKKYVTNLEKKIERQTLNVKKLKKKLGIK